jgi:putative ATP-dependent endonuclease of OLD family
MKLISFTIQNYRSITNAYKVPLSNPSVLIGPNNEGKSNIVRAIDTSTRIIKRSTTTPGRVNLKDIYDWEKDFPVHLQKSSPQGESNFTLVFQLTTSEITDFENEVGSSLNGDLPFKILTNGTMTKFRIPKQGKGALSKKTDAIAKFISKRINVVYIPAVRDAKSTRKTLQRLVDNELQTSVERKEVINASLQSLSRLEDPILEDLSRRIESTLKKFLPKIKNWTSPDIIDS